MLQYITTILDQPISTQTYAKTSQIQNCNIIGRLKSWKSKQYLNSTEAWKGCNKISHHGSLWNHETIYASKQVHTHYFFFLHSLTTHTTHASHMLCSLVFSCCLHSSFKVIIAVVISIFCCCALHVDSVMCALAMCAERVKNECNK